jgi:hypothetical protein
MPYYGLLDKFGREPIPGYHRVETRGLYALAPRSEPGSDVTFVNVDHVKFPPATGDWQVRDVALYDEVDSAEPLVATPFQHGASISPGDCLEVAPGSMRLTMRFPRGGDSVDPEIARLNRIILDLRMENWRLRMRLEKRGA